MPGGSVRTAGCILDNIAIAVDKYLRTRYCTVFLTFFLCCLHYCVVLGRSRREDLGHLK